MRHILLTSVVVLAAALRFTAQDAPVKIPLTPTRANDGQQMYVEYCAPCHGLDGRGHGPRASALKIVPSDLSILSKNNKGTYPAKHVVAVLKYGLKTGTHGASAMPLWGPALQQAEHSSGGRQETATLRIVNLARYIESLQAK